MRFAARLTELEAQGFAGLVFWDAAVMIESRRLQGHGPPGRGHHRWVDPARAGAWHATATAPTSSARSPARCRSAEKAKLADYVIDNSGDRAATEARTREVYRALIADLQTRAVR